MNESHDYVFRAMPDATLHVSDTISATFVADRTLYKLIWVACGTAILKVDGVPVVLDSGQLAAFTPFHHLEVLSLSATLRVWGFNSEFYCIYGHDSEVSCNGLLFYGASQGKVISVSPAMAESLSVVFHSCKDECRTQRYLQDEMLRTLLKQLIIHCTRQARMLYTRESVSPAGIDTVRQFHILVDRHFRERKAVCAYARLLNVTPKTLSRMLKQCGLATPLVIIHDRILAEAKRLLLYTDKSTKEISWMLGFPDLSDFSRFFMSKEGVRPSVYRKNGIDRKNDHS